VMNTDKIEKVVQAKNIIPINIVFQVFSETTNYVQSDCNAITFINKGDGVVMVNNAMPLATDQSISISQDQWEKDVTRYTINFIGSTVQQCVVIRKFYNV
jgi:hypothetical protein